MIVLRLERRFSATHQIRIAGEIEPVHGHEFRAEVEVESGDDASLDASEIDPALASVLAELSHTHLEAVERAEGGHASAERIACWVHGALARALAGDPRLRVRSATVHEAWGCAASYTTTGATPDGAR